MARPRQTLPYLRRVFYVLSCAAWGLVVGCNLSGLDTASTQRELGEETLSELGLAVEILPGVVRARSEEEAQVTMRFNAGVGRISLRTTERASGELLTLKLANVHREAQARVRLVRSISSTTTLENECSVATLDVNCMRTPANAFCRSLTSTRLDQTPTELALSVRLQPCREVIIEVAPPEELGEQPVSFVVLGSLEEPQVLERVTQREQETGGEHDFYVLLGDALSEATTADVAQLDQLARRAGEVIVALPGEQELAGDEGVSFERRFGSFDHAWTVKNVQFMAFYSAEAQLSPRGISNINSLLRALQSEDQRWRKSSEYDLPAGDVRAMPLFGFTHTPPIDPRGARGGGFESRPQGAMTLSLLAEFAMHTLFAGRILTNASQPGRPDLRIVASQDTRLARDEGRYLVVTLTSEESAGSVRAGNRFMSIESRDIP